MGDDTDVDDKNSLPAILTITIDVTTELLTAKLKRQKRSVFKREAGDCGVEEEDTFVEEQ